MRWGRKFVRWIRLIKTTSDRGCTQFDIRIWTPHTSRMIGEEKSDGLLIERVDIDTGWVRFQAGNPPPPQNELPVALESAFATWLTRNPAFKIRNILPIVADGYTVAINVWFE